MYVSGDILATPCETKIVVGGVLLEARILPRLRQNTRLRMQMRRYNGHRIHTVLAGIQFRLPPSYADGATARFVTYMFKMRFRRTASNTVSCRAALAAAGGLGLTAAPRRAVSWHEAPARAAADRGRFAPTTPRRNAWIERRIYWWVYCGGNVAIAAEVSINSVS